MLIYTPKSSGRKGGHKHIVDGQACRPPSTNAKAVVTALHTVVTALRYYRHSDGHDVTVKLANMMVPLKTVTDITVLTGPDSFGATDLVPGHASRNTYY